MLTTNEIRKKFLDFFNSKGHTVVASDSLVPKDDPTVLFTTAGMQQFKRQFLGDINGYTRAASSQKCLRTDDLDQVGRTAFHHTFFEMLGNFSFGDYFKKEAIDWAWEFLTQELNIPADKLWVSVYKDDTEAEKIWRKVIKIPADKLVRLGDKNNFWPADAREKGPNGPCGPCSEIFYDYGENPDCQSKKCDPDCDCGRFSEVWNLVFTQFNRHEGGILEPLPAKNIDTGMGLERLAAVVQEKKNNFDTDVFAPILEAIDREAQRENINFDIQQKRVLADHMRAIVFAIGDGVIPSNKERGSVIKRLIADVTDVILQKKGKPFIHKLVPSVVAGMKEPYPELSDKIKEITVYVKKTSEDYQKVFRSRIPELKDKIKATAKLPEAERHLKLGELTFNYRDTYGLTLPTIRMTMSQAGISEKDIIAARSPFQSLMKEQQERSRATSKMSGDVFTIDAIKINLPKTEFAGYYDTKIQSKILGLIKENQEVNAAAKGETVQLILDKSPFYAESGGQIGDTGVILSDKGCMRVQDTKKVNDVFIHYGTIEKGSFHKDELVQSEIDSERRLSIMRNHTATHIMQAALREILGPHVQQQGSLVAEDRLRFDFTHPQSITKEQVQQIEDYVNARILASDEVSKDIMPLEEAKKKGALAFFAEKYTDVVRVVSIDGYSQELCGGTHLKSTGQIGLFKITNECAIAQGIRRIEAKTGTEALALIRHQQQQLAEIANVIKAPTSEIVDRIRAQANKCKTLQKELDKYRFDAVKNDLDTTVSRAETVKNIKIITTTFHGFEMDIIRKVADLIKNKVKSSVIVLGSICSTDAYILIAVTDNLIDKGIKANELIGLVAPLIGGSGGGRAHLAQAGSKNINKLESAMKKAKALIKNSITSGIK